MKAIQRSRYGSPDVLELRDVPTPVPGDGEVLVGIHAASVNRADLDYLTGTPFITKMGTGLRGPKHPGLGLDAAGVVEAVGPGVTRFAPGDRVFGNLTMFGYGAFAEFACAPGTGMGADAGRRHLRGGRDAPGVLDHRLPGTQTRADAQARRAPSS